MFALSQLCRNSVATLSQQNRRLEANQRERRRMVTYCLTNTNCARADDDERPRTAIQWLAAPFPSRLRRTRERNGTPLPRTLNTFTHMIYV
jgi:hypothetical protein